MVWIYYLLLFFIGVLGFCLNFVSLPGIWLIVAAAGAYAFLTDGVYIGLWGLVTLLVLGVVAEILETSLGGVAVKRAGGSKRGMFAAILGGIVGAVLGTPFLPPVGTVAGACLGSFVAAFGVEFLWLQRNSRDALRIGSGAAVGRFMGIMTKLVFGGVMLLLTLILALPFGNSAPATLTVPLPVPIPTTAPATLPTTLPVGNPF